MEVFPSSLSRPTYHDSAPLTSVTFESSKGQCQANRTPEPGWLQRAGFPCQWGFHGGRAVFRGQLAVQLALGHKPFPGSWNPGPEAGRWPRPPCAPLSPPASHSQAERKPQEMGGAGPDWSPPD